MTRKELCEAHYGMVAVVVDNMKLPRDFIMEGGLRDDLVSIGYEVLVKASKEFDATKGLKFRTFASSRIRGAVRNEIKRTRRERKKLSPYGYIPEEVINERLEALQGEDTATYDWTLVDQVAPTKDPDRTLYYECIIGDSTVKECSEALGITKNNGQLRLRKIKKNIRKEIN